MSDFQTESTPTARKEHKCCECYGVVQPGQQYSLVTGCWDGDMDTFKTCMPCVEARTWATAQPEWGGDGEHLYYFGRLDEDLADLAPEIRSEDGRRFHAYRMQVLMNRRREAGRSIRAAA